MAMVRTPAGAEGVEGERDDEEEEGKKGRAKEDVSREVEVREGGLHFWLCR